MIRPREVFYNTFDNEVWIAGDLVENNDAG